MPNTAVHAHRGSADAGSGIAENTLASFDRARRLGADGVELDVRMSADGALVVHHDPGVEGLGPICGLDARELPAQVPCPAPWTRSRPKLPHPDRLAARASS